MRRGGVLTPRYAYHAYGSYIIHNSKLNRMKPFTLLCSLALFLVARAGMCAEPASDLRSKVEDSRAWYLAVKDLPKGRLSALLSEDWVVKSKGSQTLWQVVRWLAFHDPQQAIDWLKADPSRFANADLWRAVMTGWTEKDPDKAFQYFLDWTEAPDQRNLLSVMFAAQIKTDIAWILPHLEMFETPEMQYWVMADHTWSWAKQEPEVATRWIVRFKGAERQANYVNSAFAQWGRQNPDKAWAFLQTIDGDLYEPAVNGFARGLMMRDLDEGLAFLDDMEEAGLSRRVLHTIGLECGERDTKRGFALLERLKRQSDVDVFGQTFLQRLAQGSPDKAAKAIDRVKNPAILSELVSDIASAWARKDPIAAMKWAEANSEAATLDRSTRQIMRAWGSKDRPAAEKWIESLPDGDRKEQAIAGFKEASKL